MVVVDDKDLTPQKHQGRVEGQTDPA